MSIQPNLLFFALIGGVIPAIVWLFFWLREDAKRPEPGGLIFLTFLGGMLVVPIVIPLQLATYNEDLPVLTFFIWSVIEEVAKFLAAYFIAIKRKAMNEPIDPIIYMLTAALGFVAVENTLFILSALLNGGIAESIITGDLRFIGASLLHTISSASIGVAMALSYHRYKMIEKKYIWAGLGVAIALHTVFNLSIIKEGNSFTLVTFGFVWIAVVLLMLVFEKVKKFNP